MEKVVQMELEGEQLDLSAPKPVVRAVRDSLGVVDQGPPERPADAPKTKVPLSHRDPYMAEKLRRLARVLREPHPLKSEEWESLRNA